MISCRRIVGAALLSIFSVLGCDDDATSVSNPRYSAQSDSSFAVGDSSVLLVDNFAGNVTVLPGNPGVVDVVATRWSENAGYLDDIVIDMVKLQNGVSVTTTNPQNRSNVLVNLDITVPLDTRPTLQNAAGTMFYKGLGEGACSFSAAAGTIELELPVDANVEVYLSVAAGSIELNCPVTGQVSEHVVDGIIGTGADGRIEARLASGTIVLSCR